jgi:hypothetical protein
MSTENVKFQMESNNVGMGISKVAQVVKFSDFTDDGSDTNGDLIMTKSVPAGSFIIGSKVTVSEGFVGDTTATLSIGVAKDGNDLSGNGSINVLAAARNLVASAFTSTDNGPVAVSTDQLIYLLVAGGADFSAITAGKMLVEVFYLSTNVELVNGAPTEIHLNQE